MRHLKRKNFIYMLNINKIKNMVLSVIENKKIFLTKKNSKILISYFNKVLNSYNKKGGKRKNFLKYIIKKYSFVKKIKKKDNYLKRKLVDLRRGDMAKIYLVELI